MFKWVKDLFTKKESDYKVSSCCGALLASRPPEDDGTITKICSECGAVCK